MLVLLLLVAVCPVLPRSAVGDSGDRGDLSVVQWDQLAPETRVREGSHFMNQRGSFRLAGDRVAFQLADVDRRLIVLENLTLERIAAQLAKSSDKSVWSVSGTITEYRGSNYLLVTRAVLKSEAGERP